jgi:protein required for attachment to host cells
MTKTWILAAHRSGAKFYEHTGPGALELVRTIDHPTGRLLDREMVSDRKGRKHEGTTNLQGTADPEVDPARHEAETFARSLAAALTEGRNAHAFERLVLVAEPRFLGLLRAELDAPTAAMVLGSVNHALTDAPVAELREHLKELLAA